MSPVKFQGSCGSCAAFASIAVVESCFKIVTGSFGNYSEQELLDCASGFEGANKCHGAPVHSYLEWLAKEHNTVATAQSYPYDNLNTKENFSCRDDSASINQNEENGNRARPKVKKSIYKYDGSEELLKEYVSKTGVVAASIHFTDETGEALKAFRGDSIFQGCTTADGPKAKNGHAMAVVGYGNEEGMDYWLIKNSWGDWWGDKGFFKLERGVKACGIGKQYAGIECCDANSSDC